MAVKQFKRLFFKGYTMIFIIYLTAIGLLSYYFTHQERLVWEEMFSSRAEYTNLAVLGESLKQYGTGWKYFLQFLFSGDIYMLYVISIFVIMGIFLSAELLKQKNDGIGVYYLTRNDYRNYLNGFCGGIVMYLAAMILISMFILIIVSHLVGGFAIGTFAIGLHDLVLWQQIFAAVCHIGLLILYTGLAMLISAMISMYFNNLFFARIFPAAVFVVIPQVLGGTLANVFHEVGTVLCNFIPVKVLSNVETLLATINSEKEIILETGIALAILMVIFIVVYIKNVNRFSKEYL